MCVADGVPTPTITWKKPGGTEVRKVTATENVVDVEMKNDQDFGQYTCEAKNEAGSADTRTVQVQQISKNYFTIKIYSGTAPLAAIQVTTLRTCSLCYMHILQTIVEEMKAAY